MSEPGLSSVSTFVRIIPSSPKALSKSEICSRRSFPEMLSPINTDSCDFDTLFIFWSSLSRFALFGILPAVSMRTMSSFFALACSTASKATAAGSEPPLCVISLTLRFFACSPSCSVAAALNVSAAATTSFRFLSWKYLTSFAIVVVFPVPFTPRSIIVGISSFS